MFKRIIAGTLAVAILFVIVLFAQTMIVPAALDSRIYNFKPQAPGGSLSVGSNTITMRPCPLGVSGSHTVAAGFPHLLYVSGGAGANEAVPIAGGTCTSGAASGTLVITAANTHTGAWTIKPNSNGVQEAIYAAGATGRVQLPGGTIDLWGNLCVGADCVTTNIFALTIPGNYNTSMRGLGQRNTAFSTHFTTGGAIVYETSGTVDTGDYSIVDSGGTTHTSGVLLRIRQRTDGMVNNILFSSGYDSVVSEGNARVTYEDLTIYNYHRGMDITCYGVSGATCSNEITVTRLRVLTFAANARGVNLQDQTTGIIFIAPFISGGITGAGNNTSAFYATVGVVNPLNEIIVVGGFLDSHTVCASLNGNGATYNNNSIQFLGVHFACTNYGILAGGYIQDVSVVGSVISASGGGVPGNAGAIALTGNTRRWQIRENSMDSDGQACWYISGVASNIYSSGNVCGKVAAPINAINQSAVLTDSSYRDNVLASSGTLVVLGAAPVNLAMSNNTGIDDVIPAVASGATVTFPVNPSFTLTGTTPVGTAAVPVVAGSKYTFIATNAAPGAWTAGATIGNTFTPTQNVPVSCLWDGTKVYCKP